MGRNEMTDERFIVGENGIPRPSPAFREDPPEQESEQYRGEPFARRVTSYFLGQMSEDESERFEDECLAQKIWPSQIKFVEDDLIDLYLHEELSAEQRRLFERNYLNTEARQERVRVAATLLRRVCVPAEVIETPAVTQTWADKLKAFWRGGLTFRTASALIVLVVVVCAAWLYLSRVQRPRIIATLELTNTVIRRSPGVQPRRVELKPDADALRVFLTLPENVAPAPRYRVELDNEEGETTNLDVEGQDARTVTVLIPASRLSHGQLYVLTLFAVRDGGEEQPGYGTYTFAVE